ncbi:hypothetical protein [Corynebacterium sp.]|uniref:hypothetical protein n=1 Tax=Corynebacterium sp. TaxID=1720 RepID=UPI0019CB8646|nr:hypothetical protein [Corynebacterium sp.]HHU67347.1 hypothetical protein [Corynebacterium sp.]
MSPSLRNWMTAFMLLIPLILGATVAAVTHLDPARSWSSADEPAAAPAPVPSRELVDARRAAGEAGAQAGFLTTGTGELRDGVAEMRTGAEALPGQFSEAVTGAQRLHQGLVELQAGVGQLGTGANDIADGVGNAVDQVIGLGALQGQLLGAIDSTLEDIADYEEPELVEARARLLELRGQVEMIRLDGPVAEQLEALKDGSRELANQLGVPGYAFHDGIYTATRGAQDLSYGLTQAQGGVDEAVAGVDKLDEGAQRIDDMATRTQDRIGDVQRALPATMTTAAGETETEEALLGLSPMFALLIASLALIGGAFAGATRRWWVLAAATPALTAAGLILLWLVGVGATAQTLAWSALVLALGVVASATATRALLGVFGVVGGSVAAGVLGLAQVGVVGWVWKSLTTSEVSGAWQIAANLSPLSWATSGLTTAGNDASTSLLWLALGVLGGMAVLGLIGGVLDRQGVRQEVDVAEQEPTQVIPVTA